MANAEHRLIATPSFPSPSLPSDSSRGLCLLPRRRLHPRPRRGIMSSRAPLPRSTKPQPPKTHPTSMPPTATSLVITLDHRILTRLAYSDFPPPPRNPVASSDDQRLIRLSRHPRSPSPLPPHTSFVDCRPLYRILAPVASLGPRPPFRHLKSSTPHHPVKLRRPKTHPTTHTPPTLSIASSCLPPAL